MLGCAKRLKHWGGDPTPSGTYHELVAGDDEVVEVLALLTGSVEAAKEGVQAYLGGFARYAFLWQTDLAAEYAKFMQTRPTLEVRPRHREDE